MTTQAVTPSSAAAGLGLLNHPSMNFMMMHGIGGVMGHGMGHGMSPLSMLQNLQNPMGHNPYSHTFPPVSCAGQLPVHTPPTHSPVIPPTVPSPAQIVPTQPMLPTPPVEEAKIEEIDEKKSDVESNKSDQPSPVSSPKIRAQSPAEEQVENDQVFTSETAADTAAENATPSPPAPKIDHSVEELVKPEKPSSRASTPQQPAPQASSPIAGLLRTSQNSSPKAPKTPVAQFHPALHGLGNLLSPGGLTNGINPALIQQQILLAQQQIAAQQQQAQQQVQIQQLQQALAIAQQNAAVNPLLQAFPQIPVSTANSAAAQQAASILATAQAQALQQRNQQLFGGGLNPGINPLLLNGLAGGLPGAKATAQQAITAAEKMYRDALQNASAGQAPPGLRNQTLPNLGVLPNLRHDAQQVPNSSDVLKQLNLLRQSQNQ